MNYSVVAKLGNMKKEQDWSVYPRKAGDATILIQCDKRIAQINLTTGAGIINSGKRGNDFASLSSFFGGTDFQCPPELLKKLQSVPEGDGTTSLTARTILL